MFRLHHAGREGRVTQGIDQPGDSQREPMNLGERLGRKDLVGIAAGDPQSMPDVLYRHRLIHRPQSLAQSRSLPQLGQARIVQDVVK